MVKQIIVLVVAISISFAGGFFAGNLKESHNSSARTSYDYSTNLNKFNQMATTSMTQDQLHKATGYLYGASLYTTDENNTLFQLWESLVINGPVILQDGEILSVLEQLEIDSTENIQNLALLENLGSLVDEKSQQMTENPLDWHENELYTVSLLMYDDILLEHPNFFDAEGSEYYLITPRYTSTVTQVYTTSPDGLRGEKIYTPPVGEEFIIQCNDSEVYSNITIEFNHLGNTVTYSPHIQLEDGSIFVGDFGRDETEYYLWRYYIGVE